MTRAVDIRKRAVAIAISILVAVPIVVGLFFQLIGGIVILAAIGIMGLGVWLRKSLDTPRERRTVAIITGVVLAALIVVLVVLLLTRKLVIG